MQYIIRLASSRQIRAPVAQLRRASPLQGEGWGFESLQVHDAPVAQWQSTPLVGARHGFDSCQELYLGEVYLDARAVWGREVDGSTPATQTLLQ